MSGRWHTDEMERIPFIDTQCTMTVGSWLFDPERCENESTKLVQAACVHEHVFDYTICDRCAGIHQVRRMFCNQCSDSSEPHECLLTLTITDWSPPVPS